LVEVEGEDDRWRFRLDGDEIGEEGVPGTNEGLPAGIWGQGMSALCGRGRLGRDEAGRFRWETWTGRTRGDLTASSLCYFSTVCCLLLSGQLAVIIASHLYSSLSAKHQSVITNKSGDQTRMSSSEDQARHIV
jgi:hypothetical protein